MFSSSDDILLLADSRKPSPAPAPQENVQAAAVNTLLTPEEPHLCVNDLVPLTECFPFRKKKNKNSSSNEVVVASSDDEE